MATVVLAVIIAVVNDIPISGDAGMLPGGHSEAYLLLAFVVAGYGTWWLGLFDRPTDGRARR